jgi:hypothetical protein
MAKPHSALRLGSVILTAVLLGVPRTLDGRAFGSTPSVYLEVADLSPELAGFAEELSRALEESGCRVAARPTGATTVVEVHSLWSRADPGPDPSEAISFTVRDARGRRPLVLHYPPGRRAQAARALLRALDAGGTRPPASGRPAASA